MSCVCGRNRGDKSNLEEERTPSLFDMLCAYVLNNLRNAALVFNKIVNSNGVIQQLRIPNLAQNDPFLDLNLRFYIQID